MSKVKYNTKQKQLILDYLVSNRDSLLSCDEISYALKTSGTPVGKATLYRFLDSLVLSGDVRKVVDSSKKSASYQMLDKDKNCHDHMHLKCTDCGKITHLGCEFMSSVGAHILEHHNFKIDNSRTLIYGLCSECSEKGEK